MTFYIGQKVVCVVAKVGIFNHPEPDKGDIGTVCNVFIGSEEMLNLELIEWPAPPTKEWDKGWLASGFRPLISRTTNLAARHELFNKWLSTTKEEVDA